jgi:hypothetical protein
MQKSTSRRNVLGTLCGAAVAIPVMLVAQPAVAKKAEALRTALKYQETPKGDAQCSNCLHYKGETAEGSKGACAILPGDDEIDATGWCSGYVKKS